jgi:hypothetical protein
MTAPEPHRSEPEPDAGVDDIKAGIKADIEATREELGQTVEALSAKLDVSHQAKQKVDDAKAVVVDKVDTLRAKGSDVGSQVAGAATDDRGSLRPAIPAVALAVAAVVVGILIWRRRR